MTLPRVFDYQAVGRPRGPVEVAGLGLRALRTPGLDLLGLLKRDPTSGHEWIERESARIVAECEGADEVFFRVAGADPAHASPMEYGGFLVPAESRVLEKVKASRVVWIEPALETYFDFLADIPADCFGWDLAFGPSVAEMRSLRPGRLMADSDEADIRLASKVPPAL